MSFVMTTISIMFNELWESPTTHLFFNRLDQLIKEKPFKALAHQAALYTARRTQTSGSLMGLFSAMQLGEFFYSPNRLLPFTQMLWYAKSEATAPAVDIRKVVGTPPPDDLLTVAEFEKAYEEHDLEKAFGLLSFLMSRPKERRQMIAFLFRKALADEVSLGKKLINLVQTIEFCNLTAWEDYSPLWHPICHYFIEEIPTIETYPTVEVYTNQHWKELLASFSNKQGVTTELFEEIKASIIEDEKEETLHKISRWVVEGHSYDAILESIRCVAASLLVESRFDKWATTTHALHYIDSVKQLGGTLEPQDRLRGLLMGALFVKKMAILSRPFEEPLSTPLKTLDEKMHPLYFVEWGIHKGNVSRAFGALDYLINTQLVKNDVLECLAFLASKNGYEMMKGHDIGTAHRLLRGYHEESHPLQGIYLKALVRLLADSPKEQTVYNSLVNTQRIKRGFYSAPGSFNF